MYIYIIYYFFNGVNGLYLLGNSELLTFIIILYIIIIKLGLIKPTEKER